MIVEDPTGGLWQDYVHTQFDPAHLLSEAGFTLVFDGLILYLGYQVFWKRWLKPRLLKQVHEEIDTEHGIVHEDAEAHDG